MEWDMKVCLTYWGKAKNGPSAEGDDYHLLPYHCLDVAAVGALLLAPTKPLTKLLADFLSLTPEQLQRLVVFALSLHDLGKFASAFQALYPNNSDQLITPKSRKNYDGRSYRHDRMWLYFWQEIKRKGLLSKSLGLEALQRREQGPVFDTFMILMECMFGHHGQPVKHEDISAIKDFIEPANVQAAAEFFEQMVELFHPVIPLERFQSKEWRHRLELVSWHIAGIAVLADWIGSDSSYFKFQSEPVSLSEYWDKAQQIAEVAVAATDLNKTPNVNPFKSIKEHYGFEPTPLQQWAESVELNDSPQLFILEDVTGAGKTEAALTLTHRLMQAGAAEGFYFGLPTMATSNAMFGRVAKHYQQMLSTAEGKPSIVLAHGAREMNDLFRDAVLATGTMDTVYHADDVTATAQCNQWLADSRKKALLAPVGVGTIDQALLAVLPRRHQSIRLLGLNRKVLVFDEVHAADEYMFELLESLLALHLHQGGSAILLTATLSYKQRSRLAAIWQKAGGLLPQSPQNNSFPLATKISLNSAAPVIEQPLASRADVSREVKVSFLNNFESCIAKVLQAVESGLCVVWVRNSVDDALKAFQVVQSRMNNPEDALLFHSRFVLQDRKNIEASVLEIFGKSGDAGNRKGKVLVATQVFQESLDADSDLMISDICPIDDLIQRAGRLHRHTRNQAGAYQAGIVDERSAPELFVHAPKWNEIPEADWLSVNFRNTQYVYRSPGRLWLGMRELQTLGAIRMPGEARQLIEAVYSDDAYEQIPEALIRAETEFLGEGRCKANKAKSQLLNWEQYGYCDRSATAWHDDSIDISTRYSDIETVAILLVKASEDGRLLPWVGACPFAVQLSTLKLSKKKYADKLMPIPAALEDAEQQLQQQFPQAKYLQCWLAEKDPNFTYHLTTGFCERSPQ